jgi:hypothetical protein
MFTIFIVNFVILTGPVIRHITRRRELKCSKNVWICLAMVWRRNCNRNIEIFKLSRMCSLINLVTFNTLNHGANTYFPTYFYQDLNWCTAYRTTHPHRACSKIMRLAYNGNYEPQIRRRLSLNKILTKALKGLWTIWKSAHTLYIVIKNYVHLMITIQNITWLNLTVWQPTARVRGTLDSH